MTTQNHFHVDLSKLSNLRKKLGTNLVAQVGVIGAEATKVHQQPVVKYDTKTGKAYNTTVKTNTGITNAELAAVHEFGSISRGIKIRSFLRLPIMEKSKEIVKYLASKEIKELIAKGEIELVFKYFGIRAEQVIQRAFETQGYGHWDSITPESAKRKGNTSMLGTAEGILIQSGQLRRSVTSRVVTRK